MNLVWINSFQSRLPGCSISLRPGRRDPYPGIPCFTGPCSDPLYLEFLPVREDSVWQVMSLLGTFAPPPPSQFRPWFFQVSRPQNSLTPFPGPLQASSRCLFLGEDGPGTRLVWDQGMLGKGQLSTGESMARGWKCEFWPLGCAGWSLGGREEGGVYHMLWIEPRHPCCYERLNWEVGTDMYTLLCIK